MRVFWARLTNVQTTQPISKNWRVWLFSSLGLVCGVLFLILLPLYALQLVQETDRNELWIATTVTRAISIILLALWIGVWQPWRLTNMSEQRQGRVLSIVCLIIMAVGASLIWLDADIYRFPVAGLEYINLVVINSQILWLSRRGWVRLGAFFAIGSFLLQVIINISDAPIATVAVIYMFGVLIAGLLIRWWAGLLLAAALPLLYLLVELLGGVNSPTTLLVVLIYTIILVALAGVVALYAQSLEQALQQADARTAELTESQNQLAITNMQLENQTHTLQNAQDELQRFVAQQEAQIAEAVATIRERSIEIHTIQTPLIRVAAGVLVAPLIGTWDRERSQSFLIRVLQGIEQQKVHTVVLDLTGLTLLNAAAAQMLERVLKAAQLLGCRGILVGIQPEMAQTLVNLNLDFSDIHTASDLADAVMYSLRFNQRFPVSLRS